MVVSMCFCVCVCVCVSVVGGGGAEVCVIAFGSFLAYNSEIDYPGSISSWGSILKNSAFYIYFRF